LAKEPVVLGLLTCISDCCAPSRFFVTSSFAQASSMYSLIIGRPSTRKTVIVEKMEKPSRISDELLKNSNDTILTTNNSKYY